jgi:hypothetical protein
VVRRRSNGKVHLIITQLHSMVVLVDVVEAPVILKVVVASTLLLWDLLFVWVLTARDLENQCIKRAMVIHRRM